MNELLINMEQVIGDDQTFFHAVITGMFYSFLSAYFVPPKSDVMNTTVLEVFGLFRLFLSVTSLYYV